MSKGYFLIFKNWFPQNVINQNILESYISLKVSKHFQFNYEWAKWMKFLFLAVIWRSPPRHTNSFKTFSNICKKCKYIFMIVLWLAESFKTMIRLDSTRPVRDALRWLISRKKTIDEILTKNLGSISLIIWKLCLFRHRNNFGNFQQFISS